MPEGEEVEPLQVPVHPVPTTVRVLTLDEEGVVAMEIGTPTGNHVTFYEPGMAEEVGDSLKTAAAHLRKPKLVTPPTGLIVPE